MTTNNRRRMGTTDRNKLSFLSQRSTFIVVIIRIIVIFLSQAVNNGNNGNTNGISILFPFIPQEWIYSPAVMSILVRSQYTLKHVREAIAIQNLSSSTTSTIKQLLLLSDAVYNPSQSIRLPPLLLMSIKSFVEYTTDYHELYIKIFLLIVDILIATMIEGIGRNILLFKQDEDEDEDEDEEEKVILPEVIQPPNSHIFPISYYSSNSSSSSSPPQEEKEEGEESKTNSTTTTTTTTKTTKKRRPSQSSLLPLESIPLLSSQLYFCSILFVVLPADLYCCYQNITTLFLVASIYESSRRDSSSSKSLSTFFLAIATYIEPHHIAFLIPVIILHNTTTTTTTNRNKSNNKTSTILLPLVLFGIWSLSLQYLSYYSVIGGGGGSRTNFYGNILGTIYGCGWKNMGPNLSVQWYFHMQLFSRFRSYFGTLVLGLPYVVVGPLAIRLYKYPMELVAIFSLLWTIMRPVGILYDVNISLCFMLLCPRTLARVGKLSLVAIISMWVPVLLYIVDYWMWLEPGTGNANYIFFQCLAYNVFLGMILGQFVSACVQRDKALRLVRKEEKEKEKEKEVTTTMSQQQQKQKQKQSDEQ